MKTGMQNGRKLNRKRIMAILVLIAGLVKAVPEQDGTDVFFRMTAQVLPLLTFETEYGSPDKQYTSGYEVPDWFYEDEKSANTDLAVEGASPEKEQVIPANQSLGTTYTLDQLSQADFLTSKIFVVDNNTSMTDEELDVHNLLDTDVSLPDLQEGQNPEREYKILIYHTHGSESFADSREGVKEDTVIGMGSYLTQLLEEQYDIPVYHDETLYDVIDGVLDRSKAYENAYDNVVQILKQYPSIEVVIDLHRDGVDEETHLVTEVNGKPTAKIMFLNGVSRSARHGEISYLENPNKQMNLAFSFQMFLAGKEDYGDYVRKIYVRSLRYNLHIMPRATLIEAGAQNNTLEEERNAMEPLAAILDKVLRKKE